MRALCAIRPAAVFVPLLVLLLAPAPTSPQTVAGQSLRGDWVRVDSNNDPADQMRVTVNGSAVLTFLPPTPTATAWKVGDVLWQSIQADGTLQVRGSDGRYYAARLTFNGPDEIHLDIAPRTPGFDQTWRRLGPDISGDWVLVGPLGTPGAGTRIEVQGTDGTVRFLAPTAPQVLRSGRRLWQRIGASGGLETLGSDNQYHAATWSLVAPDRIRVDAGGIAGGPGQIWVRPGAVASAQAGLLPAPPGPNAAGSALTPPSNLPGSGIPGPSSAPPRPCAAAARRFAPGEVQWGFGLSSPSNNPVQVETLGIGKYWRSGFSGSSASLQSSYELTDWELARLPAFALGQAFVWQARTRNWTERHDLAASEFDREIQNQRDLGNRLHDLEAYATSAGMRYAGVWVANSEGFTWTARYDMTQAEYVSARQDATGNGLRVVDLEAYATPDGTRHAAVWYQSCDNTTWFDVLELDRATFDQQRASHEARGFRLVDLESYRTSAGQRYAVLWEQVPATTAWAVETDQNMKGWLNLHRQYEDQGLRLIDFESYDTANGPRYAGVWAENEARHDFAIAPALDAAIQAYQKTHGVPGISVAIIQNGEFIYRRGFGWADVANQKTANSQTLYLAASVAKVIGATLAAKLEEEGRLDLWRRTSDFVGLPSDHTHTIEQLLSKTGCVWHYAEGPTPAERFYQWRDRDPDPSDPNVTSPVAQMQAPLLSFTPPGGGPTRNCTPGRFYHYSTHGFTFVGAVLEKVLQEDIHTIIQNRVAVPYALESLRTVAPLVSIGGSGGTMVPRYDLAQGYGWAGTTSQPVAYEDSSWKVLGGGLQIDALDLARFGWLVLDGAIVSPATRDGQLWRSRTGGATLWPGVATAAPAVGLGWEVREVIAGPFTTAPAQSGLAPAGPIQQVPVGPGPRRVAEHGGIADGARSQVTIFRDDGLVVAVLTNQRNSAVVLGGHPIQGFGDQLGQIVLRNPPR